MDNEIFQMLEEEISQLEKRLQLKITLLSKIERNRPGANDAIEMTNNEIECIRQQIATKRSMFGDIRCSPRPASVSVLQSGEGRRNRIGTADQEGQRLADEDDGQQRDGNDESNSTFSTPPLRRSARLQRQNQVDTARLSNFSDLLENVDDEPVEDWPLDNNNEDLQNMDHFFTVEQTEESISKSRNTRTEKCSVILHNIEEAHRPDLIVENVIAELFRRVIGDRPAPKYIQLQIAFPEADRPFYIPLRPPEQNTPAVVAAALDHLYRQSGDIFDLRAGPLETKVIAVWPLRTPTGRGACSDVEHHVTRRVRSMTVVRNPNDRFCLAKSIVIGLAARKYLVRPERPREERFRQFVADEDVQMRRAERIMRAAGVPLNLEYYTIRHARKIQANINEVFGDREIRLVIFSKEHNNQIIFKGFEEFARYNLCLYLEARHYNFIAQPRQLFQANAFCVDCERSIKRRTFHPQSCTAVCRLCYRFGDGFPCVADRTGKKCDECQFIFPTQNCFEHHKARGVRNGNAICTLRYTCRRCGGIVYADQRRHICYKEQLEQPCRKCGAQHNVEFPYCYIQPLDFQPERPQQNEPEPDNYDDEGNPLFAEDESQIQLVEEEEGVEKPLRFVFFDIETMQTERMTVANRVVKKHVPNLLCADVLCAPCIGAGIGVGDRDRMAPYCVCGIVNLRRFIERYEDNPRRLVFKAFEADDANPVDSFLDFLLQTGPPNIRTVVLSHNGGKFDSHFCLDRLYQRNLRLKLITTGLKIYSLAVNGRNIRETIFKDSLNFFLCGLDKLPKTFGIQALVADKPYFPHIYNKLENIHVERGTLPELSYYEPEKKMPEERARFLEWYDANRDNTPFLLSRDLVEYCANDVAILRESCLSYRRLFLEVAQIDPFASAVTTAGLAMATFRKHHLPMNTLVNLPEGGFDRAENQSAIALKFFRLFEMQNNCQVQTQQWSVGEARVQDSGYRLDGLWRRGNGQPDLAIEFMGCYFHGCNTCYKNRALILAGGRTAEELWQRTQRRLRELKYVHGYELLVVWECEFKSQLRRDPAIRRLHDSIFIATPLDPRADAYRGGRTELFVFHYACKEDEEIVCIDINSLYPNEMKKGSYPIGMPQLLKRESLPLDSLPWKSAEQNPYRGLLKCRVLAPIDLRYPLLPYRTREGVLTFPLCAACADERNQRECNHVNAKRSWVTAYTEAELNKALSLGYSVIDLFEVWNWKEWAYMENENGLFTEYVNRFLKIKAEASGLPNHCPDAATYIRQYMEDEGIELEEEKIARNEGLRFLAKVLLNSLYGKFGQRPFKTTVHTTTTAKALHKLLDDETHAVLDVEHVSELMDRVVTSKKACFCPAPRTNCLPIAIYVTSYARLRLYDYMEQTVACGGKILYGDTDSLFYARKIGAPGVPEGECLGQMKREFEDRRIQELIAAASKNYAFLHINPKNPSDIKAVSKIRGFKMNYAASQIVNYERMKALIFATFNIDEEETMDDIVPPNPLLVETVQFLRTKRSEVYTQRGAKQWKCVYSKGRVIPGMEAHPFGYRDNDAPLLGQDEDADDGLPPVRCQTQ